MNAPCAVYRHFDRAGVLLYVGIALSPTYRLSQHMAQSPWADQIARVEIDRFDSREEAEEAERLAILNEAPLHNKVHSTADATPFFVKRVGDDVIAERLGVTASAVRNASVKRRFPARWALEIARLSAEYGVPYPACGFSWSGELPDDGTTIADMMGLASRSPSALSTEGAAG